ncbi:MAG: hypothetical protein ACK4OE_15540 [Acidovorax sp.]
MIPYPTLLRVPTWYGGLPDGHVLPLEPTAYQVEQTGPDRWTVTLKHSGEVVYQGIGPVEVVESPAPF